MSAAQIKAAHPVAFGDAFAIALAQAERASLITGDEEIRKCAVVPGGLDRHLDRLRLLNLSYRWVLGINDWWALR